MSLFDLIYTYREGFLSGLLVTLKLCLIIWVGGIILGVVVGVASAKWRIAVGFPARVSSFVLSGIPVLVFLFWLHYPAQALLDIVIDPFFTAAATLTILNIFAVADIVRTVMVDFPTQYIVAARVCGMPDRQTLLKIQLPIVLRQIIPGVLLVQVTMLQATLFASLISVEEIFRVAQRINASVYRPVELYSTLAVFFLAICLPLSGLAHWMKSRFTRDVSEN